MIFYKESKTKIFVIDLINGVIVGACFIGLGLLFSSCQYPPMKETTLEEINSRPIFIESNFKWGVSPSPAPIRLDNY